MNKKKWLLLILCVILVLGYIKLFYKTYNKNIVPKSADYIIAIDVKRITNTILWNIITTPSQWKIGGIFLESSSEINWRNMVKIPDYIFIFHTKNQPANAWYTVLQIKNEKDFTKGLHHYYFQKLNNNEYISEDAGIHIFKNGNQVLVGNASVENKKYLTQIAEELFTQKEYISKEILAKTIDAQSHIAMYIEPNNFLQQDAVITANFNKHQLEINGIINPNKQYSFTENNFNYPDSSLLTFGFTQPTPTIYNLLSANSKSDISKATNLNIDSVFLKNNKWYSLDLAAIKLRTDSAISYTYDSNFNKVEKVVINNIQEPSFYFTITGDSITNIYNYWQHNNKLEQTNAGQLFLPMPFVKSYYNQKNNNELNITSANYQSTTANKNINCIFFLNILFPKIPEILFNLLPENIIKTISNIESLQIAAQKKHNQIFLHASFNKKENNLPILAW